MKRVIAALLAALLAPAGYAATILTADPIAASVLLQPDGFKCTFGLLGGGTPLVKTFPAVKNPADGSVRLEADLTAVLPIGIYTNVYCVSTKAGVTDSTSSNVLSQVVIGVLPPPQGLMIIIR